MHRLVIVLLVACGSSAPKPTPAAAPPPVAVTPAEPPAPPADCEELESCRTACIANVADACVRGAEIAFEMSKEELDYTEAMTIAAQFADRGCTLGAARACTVLGTLTIDGRGTAKDEARALELYTRGCDGGDGHGCESLAFTLERAGNEAEAFARYERACELKSARGCRALGMKYADGVGRPADRDKALVYLERGCTEKDTLSCGYVRDVKTRLYPLQRVKVVTFQIGHAGLELSKATRTKAEAKKLADAAVKELGRGAAFDAVVKKYGDVDRFSAPRESEMFRHDLTGADPKAAEFENKIFALKPKTAYASENPSFGYVIFYRR